MTNSEFRRGRRIVSNKALSLVTKNVYKCFSIIRWLIPLQSADTSIIINATQNLSSSVSMVQLCTVKWVVSFVWPLLWAHCCQGGWCALSAFLYAFRLSVQWVWIHSLYRVVGKSVRLSHSESCCAECGSFDSRPRHYIRSWDFRPTRQGYLCRIWYLLYILILFRNSDQSEAVSYRLYASASHWGFQSRNITVVSAISDTSNQLVISIFPLICKYLRKYWLTVHVSFICLCFYNLT